MSVSFIGFVIVALSFFHSSVETAPANDNFANYAIIDLQNLDMTVATQYNMAAKQVTSGSSTYMTLYVSGSTVGATSQTSFTTSCTSPSGADVWFLIKAPVGTTIQYDTCMSTWDTVLCDRSCSGLTFYTSNDDDTTHCGNSGSSNRQSYVSHTVQDSCGETIRVGGYSSSTGNYILRITYLCIGSCLGSAFGTPPNGGPTLLDNTPSCYDCNEPASREAISAGAIVGIIFAGMFGFFFFIVICAIFSRRRVAQPVAVRSNQVIIASGSIQPVKPIQPLSYAQQQPGYAQPVTAGAPPMYAQPTPVWASAPPYDPNQDYPDQIEGGEKLPAYNEHMATYNNSGEGGVG